MGRAFDRPASNSIISPVNIQRDRILTTLDVGVKSKFQIDWYYGTAETDGVFQGNDIKHRPKIFENFEIAVLCERSEPRRWKPKPMPPFIRSGCSGQAGGPGHSPRRPAPCCLIVEGVLIALADDPDGMTVVREDQVVRI
jgi:hypothetical protein